MNIPWRQMDGSERALYIAAGWRRFLPAASILIAGLAHFAPIVASLPVMPDLPLLFLLAWRAYRPELAPAWAGLPLGLAADILSGYPVGLSGTLWPLMLMAHDVIDRRLVMRDARSDWLIAAFGILAVHLGQMGVLGWIGDGTTFSRTPGLVLIGLTILLFPLVARITARIERQWLIA